MLNAYPIFKKDFKQLMIFLAGALGIQIIITALWFRVFWLHNELIGYAYYDGYPNFQAIFCVIIIMGFAGHWWAEERAGSNDWFLRRLSTSIRRVYGEKLTASLLAYVTLFAAQFALLLFLEKKTGRLLEGRSVGEIVTLWLAYAVSAYIIGLSLSRWMNHVLYVVAIGCCIQFIGAGVVAYARHYGLHSLLSSNGLFVIGLYLVLIGLGAGAWFASSDRGAYGYGLPRDRYVRSSIVTAMVLVVILAAICTALIVIPSDDKRQIVAIGGFLTSMFVSLILGVTFYDTQEKQGTRHLLYLHPISRSRLYWMRQVSALPAVFLCSLIILIMASSDKPSMWVVALATSLCLGALPFFAGLVATHAFKRPLYAALATAGCAAAAFSSFYIPLLRIDEIARDIVPNGKAGATLSNIVTIPEAFCIAFLLAVGFVLAGWRCATDRTLLSGSDLNRVIYVGRLLLFVIAVSLLIFFTGFRDLLFLLTGIDAGIG